MIITLEQATVGHGLAADVPALSLTAAPGVPTVVAVETDERPMLVSMLLGGRLKPDSGRVLIDGVDAAAELRARTALIDTPFVVEPSPGISLARVVAEEFSFNGMSPSTRAVRAFLTQHGLAEYEKIAIRSLPPVERVRLFSQLALLRPGVEGIIITSPERHGGNAAEWYDYLANAAADRGVTVVIVTDFATAASLITLGARDALAPADLES